MKIVFRNFQSPGDIIVMTGAIRDLKNQYPAYEIRMDTTCGEIWEGNPYVSHFNVAEADAVYKLGYEDIHKSGKSGRHFSSAFHLTIEERLGVRLIQSEIWPSIFLSDAEKKRLVDTKYWIINAGYKKDFPLKSWGASKYQKVVDALRGTVQFVQVGEASPDHVHTPLTGVINMIGKTTLREYLRLAYHSVGSLGPVSMHMHASAAFRRPAVVVAGGREPFRWEAYPNQRYVCTNGFLSCCAADGCWKNRLPAEDGRTNIRQADSVCVNTIGAEARCLQLITPEKIVDEILGYYNGDVI